MGEAAHRARLLAGAPGAGDLLRLQRSVGNRAVGRWLAQLSAPEPVPQAGSAVQRTVKAFDGDQERRFQVVLPDGRTVTLQAASRDTIGELRQYLARAYALEPETLRVLDDSPGEVVLGDEDWITPLLIYRTSVAVGEEQPQEEEAPQEAPPEPLEQAIALVEEVFGPGQEEDDPNYEAFAKRIENHKAWNNLATHINGYARTKDRGKATEVAGQIKTAVLTRNRTALHQAFRGMKELGIAFPDPGTMVFWGGKKGETRAREHAVGTGGAVLPDTLPRNAMEGISKILWGTGGGRATEFVFGTLSRLFAAAARGEVKVYLEDSVKWGNFFISDELPVLRKLMQEGLVTDIEVSVLEKGAGGSDEWAVKAANAGQMDNLLISSRLVHEKVPTGGTRVKMESVGISIGRLRRILNAWKTAAAQGKQAKVDEV